MPKPKPYEIGVAYRNMPQTPKEKIETLFAFGVATVHEAIGRTGLMLPYMRPIYPGAKVCGNVLTVLLQPGDNWMMHVAAELIRPGDVVVAATTSPCEEGFFGELLATSFIARGADGLVIDSGVRDVAEISKLGFPVWSKCISAQGTVKATLGSVNIPVLCAGALVNPGDAVLADDDGVVIVPANLVDMAITASQKRETNEEEKRKQFKAGILGLDIYQMREKLAKAGLTYTDYSDED